MRRIKRVLGNRSLLAGLIIIGVFLFVAVAAPILAPPDDPANPSPVRIVGRRTDTYPRPPSAEAILGTATRQADIYYSLVWGTRSVLSFGLITASLAALLGVFIGAVSGFAGGRANGVTMRITDAFLTFPVIVGVWLFMQLTPTVGFGIEPSPVQALLMRLQIHPVMLAFILFGWMSYARLTNVNIIQLKQSDFAVAASAIGASGSRILVRHLLPNALAPVIVLLARDIGAIVLLEAAFTYIGLGGATDWGNMLVANKDWVLGLGGNPFAYWWTYVPISLALIFFGVGWNLIGDGCNDLLNPRQR